MKYNPLLIPIPGTSKSLMIQYTDLKSHIFSYLYIPANWPALASALNSFITKNETGILEFLEEIFAGPPGEDAEAMYGIKSGDVLRQVDTLEEILPVVISREEKAWLGDTAVGVVMRGARWRLPAKERYSGSFQVKPKNPILLIGNTHDPVTPLISARNASAGFEGSVVLQHDGYGVSALPPPVWVR